MTSFFIPCLCVVMAKDVEVASLFQPYRCRVAHLLGSHLDQVAGAVIEARFCHLNLEHFLHGQPPLEDAQSDRGNCSGGTMDPKAMGHDPVSP